MIMGNGKAIIYTGFWINHSRNYILGSTITVTENNGFLLASFLSILVAIAGQSFWTITSYFIHQIRCEYEHQRPLFYQQQAVLRNSGSALTAALRLAQLSFNWRSRQQAVKRQIVISISPTPVYIFIALFVAVGFGLASIFSSLVTKSATTHVLIVPVECGFFESREYSTVENARRFIAADTDAARYAARCYEAHEKLGCETNVVNIIQSTNTSIRECPFADQICMPFQTPAFKMDTGLVDSNDMLGLNAKSAERLHIRKVATCAPVNSSGKYIKKSEEPFPLANKCFRTAAVERYYFGPRGTVKSKTGLSDVSPEERAECEGKGGTIDGRQKTPQNFTFEYNLLSRFASPGYDLRVVHAEVGQAHPSWVPHDDLRRSSGDVSLFFLASNDVKYRFASLDPFLGATEASNDKTQYVAGGSKEGTFKPKEPVSLLGCIDQYQICNPDNKNPGSSSICTDLGPASTLSTAGQMLKLNELQNATLRILSHQLQESGIYNSVNSLGTAALHAGRTSYSINGTFVQTAQIGELWWQTEVRSWFNASLAGLQLNLVQMVSVRPDLSRNVRKAIYRLKDENQRKICQRQTLRSVDGFQNFSTLGVVLVIFFSVQLVVVALHIHLIGGAVQQLLFKNRYSKAAWSSDGYLQLQRQAYEGAGYEGWEQCSDDDIPILRDVEKLGGLDVMRLHHPRLARAPLDTDDRGPSESLQSGKDKKSRRDLPYVPSRSASDKKPLDRNRPLPPLPLRTSGLSRAGTWLSSTTVHH